MSSPNLLVIIASTRPGRIGLPIGQWVADAARRDGRFRVDIADLAEIDLPLMDEPNHPRLRTYTHEHTRAWSARVDAADAVLIVLPEYNHSYPATIKNALDYLSAEWAYKPAAIASYGGVSGGLRSAQALKPVLTALKMMPIPEGIVLSMPQASMVDRRFVPPPATEQAAVVALDELTRWMRALAPMREPVAVSA
jgi:NAD(P)H-dependent FMN reductase